MVAMSTGELLAVEPFDLKFPLELKKLISCSLQMTNKTDENVAFKVKTTNPKKYCVRPNTGVVAPRSTYDVVVTMQVLKELPADLQCKDKFLIQSIVVNAGLTAKDITAEMFTRESGNALEECKLRVVYVAPPQPPSPVLEGSEEDSSPRASVSDNNESLNAADLVAAPREFSEGQEKSTDAKAIISKLTNEKNHAIQENNKLSQELETLRREVSKQNGGFSFMFVLIIVVLGVLLGYIVKK